MKKFLLSLAVLFGVSPIFAQQTVTVDLAENATLLPTAESETETTTTISDIEFGFINCKKGVYSGQTYLQVSGKNKTPKGSFSVKAPFAVSAITLHTGSNASVSVMVQFSADDTAVGAAKKLDTKNGDFTFEVPAENQAAGTVYTFAVTNNYNAQVTTITFTKGDVQGGKLSAGLSFAETECTVDFGDAFTAPTLTKETPAEVEYESSDDNVASVNELTGEVTIEGIGTATITARTAETTDYYAGVASYTINVLDPAVILSATFGSSNDGFTFEDGELDGLTYVWTRASNYGYMKASGYYQGAHAVEGAYLVSPVLDLTGRKNITADYRQCVGQLNGINPADVLSFAIREEGGAWTKVAITSFPEIVSGNFSPFEDAPTVDLSAYAGKKIQLGWCYTSTASAACTWEIDNVVVKGDKDSSAIATVEVENENAPVEFFNLQGVRVANPENGLYIRRQGNKVEKVVIR